METKTYRARVQKRLGHCYELAGREFLLGDEPEDATLVHGTIGPYNNPHAWIEWERGNEGWEDPGLAWEPIGEKNYPRPVYYAIFQAREVARYTQDQARELAIETNHWGPWHE